MRTLLPTLLLLLAAPDLLAVDQYRVKFSAELDRVEVHACYDGKPPTRLYTHAVADEYAGPSRVTRG